jgi:protein-L-isoaspartate(D-aspartate) O-methyltransferase
LSLDFEAERRSLVESLKRQGILRSAELIRALTTVRRESFVTSRMMKNAYDDSPLPTLDGQTISAPHMVAIMNEELELSEGQKVLEIGAGSGYHAAVCAEVVAPSGRSGQGHVFTVEYRPELAELARKNLELSGYAERVTVIQGDGSLGYPSEAPFDRILVTAAAPDVPGPIKEQLRLGGKLIIPIGPAYSIQKLFLIERLSETKYRTTPKSDVVFVPLIGKYAYSE